ncbi:MAG: protein kinase [Deltaproteobacteria bacterium]
MAATGNQTQFAPRLGAGVQLGEYVLGQPLWPLRIADAYRANGPKGAATVYVIHAALSVEPTVRDQIIAGTRIAAALPEHKHLVRTLAAGLTGDILWIATEEVDGSLVRDMLVKKRQAGTAGFGARGTGNLITGVSQALGDVQHGALASESVVVSRNGRVRIADLALGPGTIAAMQAGLIPWQSSIAPEVQAGAALDANVDVYAVGALLYEALVGSALERGGPRPSDVVPGTNTQIDEIVARACHKDREKRFGRVEVLGEVVAEALGKGGAMQTVAVPTLERALTLEQHVAKTASLAGGLSPHASAAGINVGSIAAAAGAAAAGAAAAGAAGSGEMVAATSGNVVVDRALAAALSDINEKWLISKGRLDYGPFSLADVVKQIDKGEIVAGNIIMDKDTGARGDIGAHPLLGPMVDAARARHDDQRRAQAEVKVQSAEKRRGAALYAFIALGVIGAGIAVYFIVNAVRGDDASKKVAGVSKLEGAQLNVTVSMPKTPPATKHRPGGGHRPSGNTGGPGGQNASENLGLDMSDDSDETETLGMDKVYAVYSTRGAQLGGCLQSTGAASANIAIMIDGPSGRVNFVKVNGQASGPLYNCISRTMRAMAFPTIHGPRTRAEFDINL